MQLLKAKAESLIDNFSHPAKAGCKKETTVNNNFYHKQ
jgi:hypothetical protein